MNEISRLLVFTKNDMGVFDKYEKFILSNVSQVNAIESGLRSLTYVLPGRFSDAEFASEALFSLLNLLSLYHDKILTKITTKPAKDGLPPSNFNRYTRSLINGSSLYKKFAYILSMLQYTEVLLEMFYLKRRGSKGKWNMIALIELIKVLLRLSLFKLSKKRTLLSPPHPEREQPQTEGASEVLINSVWSGKRTGFSHPKINTLQQNGTSDLDYRPFLLSKVLDKDCASTANNLVRKLSDLGILAELLFIIRPLIYVLTIRKFGHKNWLPWILSLSLESTSLFLSKKASDQIGGEEALTSLEKDERRRRYVLLGYYLLRSPFFDSITKHRLLSFSNSAKNKFLISFLAGLIIDYIPLWQKYYFYTSGS